VSMLRLNQCTAKGWAIPTILQAPADEVRETRVYFCERFVGFWARTSVVSLNYSFHEVLNLTTIIGRLDFDCEEFRLLFPGAITEAL
jgi:hypothetical protein